jgi:DNA-binding MarR family transcriptional regulator
MKQIVNFNEISIHPSAEESPGFLLWRVSTLWRRTIEAVLRPLGLTHPQFVILATTGWLTRTGEKASQAEIGRKAALDPNTTSQILRSLQAKGLIERSHTKKERSKHPILTATGAESLAKAMPAVERADAAFFASVNLKKSKMLQTLQILARGESLKNEREPL